LGGGLQDADVPRAKLQGEDQVVVAQAGARLVEGAARLGEEAARQPHTPTVGGAPELHLAYGGQPLQVERVRCADGHCPGLVRGGQEEDRARCLTAAGHRQVPSRHGHLFGAGREGRGREREQEQA
jgi:hypothetical protein